MPKDGRLSFRFRGKTVVAAQGATLLEALLPRGLPRLQRSIRYHRPRAPYCGVGYCTGCLVRVDGVPDTRACRYRVKGGEDVETENAWPSPAHDVLGVLDALFYRGLDTLHGFARPRFATGLYQRVIRSLAGYGRIPRPTHPDATPPGCIESSQFLVIGAGPSGRRAAERLAASGGAVILADRDPIVEPPEGVRALPETTVFFMPPPSDGTLSAFARSADGRPVTLSAKHVVLAPGAFDTGLWFHGNDRPGILTAEGALRIVTLSERPPFERAVVFGGGKRAAEVIDRCGAQVEAVVAPESVSSDVARRAADLGIALYPRMLVTAAAGRSRLKKIRLTPRGRGPEARLRADALILAHRRYPNSQLFFQAGARMAWNRSLAAYYPILDGGLATSVPGLFAAGEAAGFPDGTAAEASGIAAAETALGHTTNPPGLPTRIEPNQAHEMEAYYRELLNLVGGRGKAIACLCEDVLLDEVREAVGRGFTGIEVVKRYTGLGTGLCQGRYCLPDALLALSVLEGREPQEVGYITQRPPVEPMALGTLSRLLLPESGRGEA